MKKKIVSIFFEFLKLTKGWPIKTIYSGKVQILMFHRVVSDIGSNRINNDGIEVTTNYLDFLISFYLKHGFTPISINELKDVLNISDNKRYVIFTFDDGYFDNYENALPIFTKHNVPFTIYITIDFIKRKQFAWWYFIEDLIRNNNEITYLDNGLEKSINIENEANKNAFFIQLRHIIQKDSRTLDALITRYNPDLNIYYNLFLNTDQLSLIAKHPLVTIGSHSVTHPSLAKTSDQTSVEEITNSKIELEKMIQQKVEHFSYPFGTTNDVSERDIENVKNSGYLTALTTSYGDVYLHKNNLFALPRIWTSNNLQKNELLKIIYGVNAFNMRKGA